MRYHKFSTAHYLLLLFWFNGISLLYEKPACAQDNSVTAYQTDYDSARELYIGKHYREALKLFKKSAYSPDKHLNAKALNNSGLCFKHLHSYDSAILYLDSSFNLKTRQEDKEGCMKTRLNQGSVYLMRGWNKMAYNQYQELIKNLSPETSLKTKADIYVNYGVAAAKLKKHKQALDYYIKAMNLYKKLVLMDKQADVWLNTGNIYNELNNKTMATAAFDSAEKVYQKIGDSISMMQARYNKWLIYLHEPAYYDEAVNAMQKIIGFYEQNHKTESLFKIYNALAEIYEKRGRNKQSSRLRYKAIQLKKVPVNDRILALIQIGMKQRKTLSKDSLKVLVNSISNALRKVDEPDLKLQYYYLMLHLSEQWNQKDSALSFARKYYQLKIDLLKSATDKNLQELMSIRDMELKQYQIEKLSAENILVKTKNNRYKMIVLFMIILIIMSFLLIILTRRNWKNKYTISQQKRNIDKIKIENISLEKQKLKNDLELKKQEAMMEAIKLTELDKVISGIHNSLTKKLKNYNTTPSTEKILIELINDIKAHPREKDIDAFKTKFIDLHPDVTKKLSEKYAKLTHNDLNIAAGIIIGMDNFELAKIFNVNIESIRKSKYRLKKKLHLSPQQDLKQFLISLT